MKSVLPSFLASPVRSFVALWFGRHSLRRLQPAVTTLVCALTTCHVPAAPGDLDALDAGLVWELEHPVSAYSTAVQPDGKIIIAGFFQLVRGVPRSGFARLNADGTLDTAFNGGGAIGIFCMAVQADGKVLAGGDFNEIALTNRRYFARLNANGTIDSGFNHNVIHYVRCVAVQPDGKVLVGGTQYILGENPANGGLSRLNPDGTREAAFAPYPNTWVRCVAVQPDGRIVLGGDFTVLHGGGSVPRNHIARVNANGTLDTGFNPNADNLVSALAVQADGKVLVGGYFTTLQPNGAGAPVARNGIARLHANGTLDTGFDPHLNLIGTSVVTTIAVQADGKVLFGGSFNSLQPNGTGPVIARRMIARMNADGTLDTGFNPSPDAYVHAMALQADGKVLLAGDFTVLQPNGAASPTVRKGFARLQNDTATQTLTAPAATQILWERGGAAPELASVTFEMSTNGGASWSPLGAGTRIGTTANWQRSGVALPVSGQLRARGFPTGFPGIVEQTAVFAISADADNDGLLDSWERTWWPMTSGHGPHDDDDRDGYDNLIELAFGLNPTLAEANGLPAFVNEAGYLTITITKRPGASYEVQTGDTVLPESFSSGNTLVQINNATTLKVRDAFPIATSARRFLRIKVTAAP